MAKYALFISTRYYPSGGMDDFMGNYDTMPEAQTLVTEFVAMCKQTGMTAHDDICAEIAVCGEDGLQMVSRFVEGTWNIDTETPTLEMQSEGGYLGDEIADFLNPSRITEREQAHADYEAEQARSALAEQLWTQAWEAQKLDDAALIAETTAKLRELGEITNG